MRRLLLPSARIGPCFAIAEVCCAPALASRLESIAQRPRPHIFPRLARTRALAAWHAVGRPFANTLRCRVRRMVGRVILIVLCFSTDRRSLPASSANCMRQSPLWGIDLRLKRFSPSLIGRCSAEHSLVAAASGVGPNQCGIRQLMSCRTWFMSADRAQLGGVRFRKQLITWRRSALSHGIRPACVCLARRSF